MTDRLNKQLPPLPTFIVCNWIELLEAVGSRLWLLKRFDVHSIFGEENKNRWTTTFRPQDSLLPGATFFYYYYIFFFSVNEQKIFEWNQWLKIEFSQLNRNLNKELGKPKHKTVKWVDKKELRKAFSRSFTWLRGFFWNIISGVAGQSRWLMWKSELKYNYKSGQLLRLKRVDNFLSVTLFSWIVICKLK